MKSFSFKALALACVVVAGSANAGISEYVTSAKDGIVKAVKKADSNIFGTVYLTSPVKQGLPVFRSYLKFNNSYARAAVVIAATTAITAAVVKAYKHFTNPAAEATEGEVEANEANTVA